MRFLSTVVESPKVWLDAGGSLANLLQRHCGGARPELIASALSLNPGIGLSAVKQRIEVTLPPCPYWKSSSKATISAGSVLWGVMLNQMGTSGNASVEAVKRLNSELDPDRLLPGQSVSLPYSIRPVSYSLRAEWTGREDEILAHLAGFSSVVSKSIGRDHLRLVEPVSESVSKKATTPGGRCGEFPATSAWPFDSEALARILNYNRRKRLPRSVLAVVADTGIEIAELDLARIPFARSAAARVADDIDSDGFGYYGDLVGVNLPSGRGFPQCYQDPMIPGDPAFFHGTHVSGLVAGQPFSAELARAVRERHIELKELNLRESYVHGTEAGPRRVFSMPLAGLAQALSYATARGANVLNLSVESDDPVQVFADLLGNNSLVTVIAAGNAQMDLDKNEVYPAAYGRSHPERLIVVAAHGPNGSLTDFSNFGAQTVDLAAPGECIISFLPGGASGPLTARGKMG